MQGLAGLLPPQWAVFAGKSIAHCVGAAPAHSAGEAERGLCEEFHKHLAQLDKPYTLAAPMSKNAGLAKTRKAVSKRFKITGTGKVLRRRQGKRHLLQGKSRKQKRSLGKAVLVAEVDVKAIKANMPWG
jgi:large subunit ribosomal protein L35